MPLEESGVNLVLDGLSSFLDGLGESNNAIDGLGSIVADVASGPFELIGNVMGGLADIAQNALGVAIGNVLTPAFQELFSILGSGWEGALEGEQGLARLEQVIRSTGGAAGVTSQEAQDLATRFSYLAGGTDDAVIAIIDLGLRMDTISEEEMPGFIQQSLDLGAVMGDNATAARLLARAQEDPVGVLGALRRAGILVTEDMETQIKTMVEAGDTAGAYTLLMERVGEATSGAAAAGINTVSGTLDLFKNIIGEASETVFSAWLPAIEIGLRDVMNDVIPIVNAVSSTIAAFITTLQDEGIGSALVLLRDALTGAFGPEIAGAVTAFLATFVTSAQEIGAVLNAELIPALTTAFNTIFADAPTAQETIALFFGALTDGVRFATDILVNVLIPGMVAVVDWVVANWPTIQATVETVFNAVNDIINNVVVPFINDVLVPTMQAMIEWVVVNWPTIQSTITTIMSAVVTFVTDALNNLKQFWTDHGAEIMVIVTGLWTAVSTAFSAWFAIISTEVTETLTLIKDFWATWGDEIMTIVNLLFDSVGMAVDGWAFLFTFKWQLLADTLVQTWSNTWTSVQTTLQEAIATIQAIDWNSIGTYITQGIAQGISNGAQFIIEAAMVAALEAFEAAKRALGISSPSKLFEDIGKNTMEGFAQGVKDNTSIARESVATAMTAATQPAVMVADRAAASPTTINNYNTADIDIHGANLPRNRATVTDDVLLGLTLGFGLSG